MYRYIPVYTKWPILIPPYTTVRDSRWTTKTDGRWSVMPQVAQAAGSESSTTWTVTATWTWSVKNDFLTRIDKNGEPCELPQFAIFFKFSVNCELLGGLRVIPASVGRPGPGPANAPLFHPGPHRGGTSPRLNLSSWPKFNFGTVLPTSVSTTVYFPTWNERPPMIGTTRGHSGVQVLNAFQLWSSSWLWFQVLGSENETSCRVLKKCQKNS
jgi:hypothetical protein